MDESEQIMIEDLSVYRGQINMNLSGEPVKRFYAALLDLLETNGAENFLTTEIAYKGEGFVITVERLNGKDSPVKKIQRYEEMSNQVKTKLNTCRGLLCVVENDQDINEVIDLLGEAMAILEKSEG